MCPSLAGGISQAGDLLNRNKPSEVFLFLYARASAFDQFDHFSDQAHLMRAGGPRLALRTAARVNSRLVTVARHRGAGRSSGVARANIATISPFRPAMDFQEDQVYSCEFSPIEMFLSLEKATRGAQMWASSGCTCALVPGKHKLKTQKKVKSDDNGPAEGVPAGGRRVAGVPTLRALVNVRAGGHLRC